MNSPLIIRFPRETHVKGKVLRRGGLAGVVGGLGLIGGLIEAFLRDI